LMLTFSTRRLSTSSDFAENVPLLQSAPAKLCKPVLSLHHDRNAKGNWEARMHRRGRFHRTGRGVPVVESRSTCDPFRERRTSGWIGWVVSSRRPDAGEVLSPLVHKRSAHYGT